jgi:hypothetical protein
MKAYCGGVEDSDSDGAVMKAYCGGVEDSDSNGAVMKAYCGGVEDSDSDGAVYSWFQIFSPEQCLNFHLSKLPVLTKP